MNIKKTLATLTMSVAIATGAWGVPACPTPIIAIQPDGTRLTVCLHGDEFYSFTTTEDGYVIARCADGYYRYAPNNNAVSAVRAHDLKERDAQETGFLSSMKPYDVPLMKEAIEKGRANRAEHLRNVKRNTGEANNFKGLVILVEFEDLAFTRSDIQTVMSDMLNEEEYSGYTDNEGAWQTYTGSVSKYFQDATGGKFHPKFDVSTPVQVPYSVHQGRDNYGMIFANALDQADAQFDFSQYDNDGDGSVDMVFFVVAGYGSNYSGNDETFLWPHMSYINTGKQYDGKYTGIYACSTELHGWEMYGGIIAGIGTFCHEFSHTQGLPDLYDTNYSGGGQSVVPGNWDVMSGGSYLNDGRTPPTYSILERVLTGYGQAIGVESAGDYTLTNIVDSNSGLIYGWPWNEWMLMERRDLSGWDACLPGHGMLVWHVDQRDLSLWNYNQINAYPESNGVKLLRADNPEDIYQYDSARDPFPGASNITFINDDSNYYWRSNLGYPNPYAMTNISEIGAETKITLSEQTWYEAVETFQNVEPTAASGTFTAEGDWCELQITDGRIIKGFYEGDDNNLLALSKRGTLEVGNVYDATCIVFDLDSSVDDAFVTAQISYDGENWLSLRTRDGKQPAYDYAVGLTPVALEVQPEDRQEGPAKIRIKNSMKEVRIDNLRVLCSRVSGVDEYPTEVADIDIRTVDGLIMVTGVGADAAVTIYDVAGRTVAQAVATDGIATLKANAGIYIVRCGNVARKVRL